MPQALKQFHKIVQIESHEVDPFCKLKLDELFVIFQDVVTLHMEMLGINKKIINDNGLYWVVNRYTLHINRLPKYLEKVEVVTYPGKDMKFIFPRYFEVLDENKMPLVKASSTWLVLNKDNHEINLKPFDESLLPHFSKDDELPLPKKIEIVDGKEIEKRIVKLSDLDLNNHLNNTKYIEYISDALGYQFFKENSVRDFTINYLKEVAYNSEVSLCRKDDENTVIIEGKVDNQLVFIAKILYQKNENFWFLEQLFLSFSIAIFKVVNYRILFQKNLYSV